MKKIVACVANFAEGRRDAIVAEIVNSIADVSGVEVLGFESDMDHNRSVATFIGAPHAVAEAAFAGVQVAAAKIDMNRHRGQHPRIGAADVIPFVPLRNVTIAECIELARTLGARVGEALQLPVFLYAEAALQDENRELSSIRRGGYEGLRQSIATGKTPQPDFGPRRMGEAGGCVVGARDILIAFNVYLATTDVSIAKAIARAIRESSGGMPCVKALGFVVKGKAQVSMNLTDYRVTSMGAAFERIRQLAAEYGVDIDRSEIIGLMPGAALTGSSATDMQIMNFGPERILESFLDEAL